ncbi:hypothetical protein RCH14_004522 [Massilia sp. MP_M2]|uniref:hypothetical protein n=1 Tax=Massilia sp. MP_M2 TaxID=3071713 RepID=UPI00319DF46C
MAMKNMSFGKLLGIFGGFLVVILIGAVVFMKMSQTKAGPSIVTKTYAPAQAQTVPNDPAVLGQQAIQAPTQAALSPQQTITPAAESNPTAQATQGLGTQAVYPEASQQDMPRRLASIDSQLASIQSRLAAVEAKRESAQTSPSSGHTKPPRAARRVSHAQSSSKAAEASKRTSEPRRLSPQPQEVKALAVVGNRAWVRGADGAEDSVTAGDPLPIARPRVHSVDAANGVVIMSSVAD